MNQVRRLADPLTRLDSVIKNGLDWVKEIGRQNAIDLKAMIQWNEDNVRASSPYLETYSNSHPLS